MREGGRENQTRKHEHFLRNRKKKTHTKEDELFTMTNGMWLAVVRATRQPSTKASGTNRK